MEDEIELMAETALQIIEAATMPEQTRETRKQLIKAILLKLQDGEDNG